LLAKPFSQLFRFKPSQTPIHPRRSQSPRHFVVELVTFGEGAVVPATEATSRARIMEEGAPE
jgi:hypothetical protein